MPQFRMICRIRETGAAGSIGTYIAPAFNTPNTQTMDSMDFPNRRPTLSLGFTPFRDKQPCQTVAVRLEFRIGHRAVLEQDRKVIRPFPRALRKQMRQQICVHDQIPRKLAMMLRWISEVPE